MKNNIKILIFIALILIFSSLVISSINSEKIDNSVDTSSSIIFYPANVQTNQMSVTSKSQCIPPFTLLSGKDSNNQTHPCISSNQYGLHMISYVSDLDERIYFGTIDGPMSYWDLDGGDYPSIKHWNYSVFYGTIVPSQSVYNGGVIYLITGSNPYNSKSIYLQLWLWPSQYGWRDIISNEIVCDSSMEEWNFGF